jgi:large subunit ribosomal protein L10Ae
MIGPCLNKAGKFPGLLSHQEAMMAKIDRVKSHNQISDEKGVYLFVYCH